MAGAVRALWCPTDSMAWKVHIFTRQPFSFIIFWAIKNNGYRVKWFDCYLHIAHGRRLVPSIEQFPLSLFAVFLGVMTFVYRPSKNEFNRKSRRNFPFRKLIFTYKWLISRCHKLMIKTCKVDSISSHRKNKSEDKLDWFSSVLWLSIFHRKPQPTITYFYKRCNLLNYWYDEVNCDPIVFRLAFMLCSWQLPKWVDQRTGKQHTYEKKRRAASLAMNWQYLRFRV